MSSATNALAVRMASEGKVLITVSEGSLEGLSRELEALDLSVSWIPMMRFESVNPKRVDETIDRMRDFASVVVTSPRAAEVLVQRLRSRPGTVPIPRGGVWASGDATARILREWSDEVRLPQPADVAREGAARATARSMIASDTPGPVLFPCGETHREELPEALRSNGVSVEELVCYRSVLREESEARWDAAQTDYIIVGSPRVVRLLVAATVPTQRPKLVALGPTTAAQADELGWTAAAVASAPDARSVRDALVALMKRGRDTDE